jgi:hypothetical protein
VKAGVLAVFHTDRLKAVTDGAITMQLHHAQADAARAL